MTLPPLSPAQQGQLERWLADRLPASQLTPELRAVLPIVVGLLPELVEQARLLLPPERVELQVDAAGLNDRRQ